MLKDVNTSLQCIKEGGGGACLILGKLTVLCIQNFNQFKILYFIFLLKKAKCLFEY